MWHLLLGQHLPSFTAWKARLGLSLLSFSPSPFSVSPTFQPYCSRPIVPSPPAALLERGAMVSSAVGSLTLQVAAKEPPSDMCIPVLDVKYQAGSQRLYLLLPGIPSPFCLLYFKQNIERVHTSLEDLRALFPPCTSSPVCVDLALGLRWVRWVCSDLQTWAENGPGCHSGRRSRNAAFQRRRRSVASSLGIGHVPASCPWKKTHQTGPLKEEHWLGVTNMGGTPKYGPGRSCWACPTEVHADMGGPCRQDPKAHPMTVVHHKERRTMDKSLFAKHLPASPSAS